MGRTKKDLFSRFSFDGLYAELQALFFQIPDPRGHGSTYRYVDLLQMAFAMFSLKSPSMHSFQSRSKAEIHNLRTIFGIDSLCSDNCLRQGLDDLSPDRLKMGFVRFYKLLKQYNLLSNYLFARRWKIVSIDGVEHFHSKRVHCSSCLVKEEKNGDLHYSHSMLAAVLLHPDQQAVFPLDSEPIIRQDGQDKNDSEFNASKRLLSQLKKSYPDEHFLIVEDALFANGPHLDQLKELGYNFVIGVKPKKNKALFAQFERKNVQKPTDRISWIDAKGFEHHLSWANNLPLNSHRGDIRVNMLQYQQKDPRGKQTNFSWITDIKLHKRNAQKIMIAGRSRWKIENETFNTLKNQGYEFEHNFGHGYKNLSTVFAYLMLLAFTLDQIQQYASNTFIQLWNGLKTKVKVWQATRAAFVMIKFKDMKQLFESIAEQYQIEIDSS